MTFEGERVCERGGEVGVRLTTIPRFDAEVIERSVIA